MASQVSKRNKLALNSDRALGLLLIAEKYGHDKMKSVCQGFLENDLTAENCCSVYLASCKSENKVWIWKSLHFSTDYLQIALHKHENDYMMDMISGEKEVIFSHWINFLKQ